MVVFTLKTAAEAEETERTILLDLYNRYMVCRAQALFILQSRGLLEEGFIHSLPQTKS